ncbi:MAG TPA: response regulator [Planctomycetota bacterium]
MGDTNTTIRLAGAVPPPANEPIGKGILICDADPKEAATLRNSLDAAGYDVSCWIEPNDARDRLKARNYDVVIFSTNLSDKGMDSLLEDLRPRKVPPKVVLIAGEDEGDAAARCFLRTVILVNRPFKVGEVADIVEHLIGAA